MNEKKRLIVSLDNLSAELQDQLAAQYPAGFADKMIRIDKPNGDFFYAVRLETDDVNYLVKVAVKIDDDPEDDDDKGFYDDDIKGAEDIADDNNDEDDND